MSSYNFMSGQKLNVASNEDVKRYREVYKEAMADHGDATKAAFAARAAMRSVPGTENKAVLTSNQVEEVIARYFEKYVGVSKLEAGKKMQELMAERVNARADAVLNAESFEKVIDKMVMVAVERYMRSMGTAMLEHLVTQAVTERAAAAVEELVSGLSFKPRMAEPTPGRKLHL